MYAELVLTCGAYIVRVRRFEFVGWTKESFRIDFPIHMVCVLQLKLGS